ncbi:MAG: branched-chain amino acid transport system ATP-binding protein, partial [Candidatus Eremiobacteraeota bacterium]|nr:branched-chain amino acid transport system ATP-binding protein [Candidatus Eremiobacteraeota bacterium]
MTQSQSQSQGGAVPVLEVENVSTIRGRVQVLWDVSLTVGRGETVAIVGPNGAGKTTLVGSITGLVPPKSGRIRVNGTDVAGSAPEK